MEGFVGPIGVSASRPNQLKAVLYFHTAPWSDLVKSRGVKHSALPALDGGRFLL